MVFLGDGYRLDFLEYILNLLLLTLLIFVFIFIPIELITIETINTGEEIDCFDKYGNKIEDLKCEKEIECGVMSNLFNIDGCKEFIGKEK